MIRLGKSSANSVEAFGTAEERGAQKKQAKRTTLGLFSLYKPEFQPRWLTCSGCSTS
jgi:hypothetical protein